MRARTGTIGTAVALATAVVASPVAVAAPPAAVADRGAQPADGSFVASVDFSTLQATDVRGNKCEFVVEGVLSFSGAIDGEAVGTTTAVIFAPCAEALASPPGTSFDTFRFEGDFTGTVLDEPTTGTVRYFGVTRVGGQIDATVLLQGEDAHLAARADAQVAVGGTYSGVASTR